MLVLTLEAKKHGISIQDPKAVTTSNYEQATFTLVPEDGPKSYEMQDSQLERISGQLVALAARGEVVYTIEGVSDPAQSFVNKADGPSNPTLNLVTSAVLAAGGAVTIEGENLLGGQTPGVGTLNSTNLAGSLTVTAVVPGFDGNDSAIRVIDSGAGGLTVTESVEDGTTVFIVDLGDTTDSDIDAIAAAIDGAATADTVVVAVVEGGDQVVTELTTTDIPFEGGVGAGLSVSVGGIAGVITSATDTDIAVTSAAAGSAGDIARVLLRSNAKEDIASVVLG